jgi:hypothetical protein
MIMIVVDAHSNQLLLSQSKLKIVHFLFVLSRTADAFGTNIGDSQPDFLQFSKEASNHFFHQPNNYV